MWGLYVDYIGMHWDMYMQCGRHICSGIYVNNVKSRYANGPGHIIDYIEFIWDILTDSCVISAHEIICICGIHVTFERNISF